MLQFGMDLVMPSLMTSLKNRRLQPQCLKGDTTGFGCNIMVFYRDRRCSTPLYDPKFF